VLLRLSGSVVFKQVGAAAKTKLEYNIIFSCDNAEKKQKFIDKVMHRDFPEKLKPCIFENLEGLSNPKCVCVAEGNYLLDWGVGAGNIKQNQHEK